VLIANTVPDGVFISATNVPSYTFAVVAAFKEIGITNSFIRGPTKAIGDGGIVVFVTDK
jgi:hypothetical protein